jgi:hypothetical protein
MNMALQLHKSTISTEAAQLLAILRDCGIDSIWQDPEMKLLSFYLQNTPESVNHIKSEIGDDTYGQFLRQTKHSWKYPQLGHQINVRYWFLRYADGSLLMQALQTSARENLKTPAVTVIYNEQHPGFAQDHADFAKLITLFMLENFPRHILHDQRFLINRLNYYEYFRQKHGDLPLLKAFRRSVMRKEAENFAYAIERSGHDQKNLKAKTTCLEKYNKMASHERLRVMRYYWHTLAQ